MLKASFLNLWANIVEVLAECGICGFLLIGLIIYGKGEFETLQNKSMSYVCLISDTGNISVDVYFITYAVLKHVCLNILIISLNKDLRNAIRRLLQN